MTKKEVSFNKIDKMYVFECPHCEQVIQVLESEINCSIFRCGIFKHNQKQMDPHTPKSECDRFFNEGFIYGCGKPFKFFKGEQPYVEECEYI